MMTKKPLHHFAPQRYLIAGILTVIPLWITFVVFKFVLGQLSSVSLPWVQTLAAVFEHSAPAVAAWLLEPWFQSVLAVTITLIGLYFLGWTATRVLGKRLIHLFDTLMQRIPGVQTIYGATKKLLTTFQEKPGKLDRVVLINFPSKEMKTVGFVTRMLIDTTTGRELAAVYVPTTPNPTSGYIEIVPVEDLVVTDWTMDEAMSFVITGGAVAPDRIKYTNESPGQNGGSRVA